MVLPLIVLFQLLLLRFQFVYFLCADGRHVLVLDEPAVVRFLARQLQLVVECQLLLELLLSSLFLQLFVEFAFVRGF